MKKVYSVTINGRTLEGRDLKELLARAVSAKRNLYQGRIPRSQFHNAISAEKVVESYSKSEMAIAQ